VSLFGLPDVLGLRTAAIAGAVSLALGAAGGVYTGYRWERSAYDRHLTADATALAKATKKAADDQHRIDLLNQSDAVEQAYFRGRLDAQTINLVLGVPANVTVAQDAAAAAADRAGCVTFGFARVLYAGAHGVPAESLSLPSGESVNSCTALEPSKLAAAVAQDLAAGYSNAHQLDALIGAVVRNDAIATAP
jgi:hypothetical protein